MEPLATDSTLPIARPASNTPKPRTVTKMHGFYPVARHCNQNILFSGQCRTAANPLSQDAIALSQQMDKLERHHRAGYALLVEFF